MMEGYNNDGFAAAGSEFPNDGVLALIQAEVAEKYVAANREMAERVAELRTAKAARAEGGDGVSAEVVIVGSKKRAAAEAVESESESDTTMDEAVCGKPTKKAKTGRDTSVKKAVAGAAKQKRKANATDADDEGTSAGSKRKATAKTPAAGKVIARFYEDCTDADKLLINMRDRGEQWADIRDAYNKFTGETHGVSTLPNRYSRLKYNFSVIKDEDRVLLLEAKAEVEQAYEKEKWDKIAAIVHKKGGNYYVGDVLLRQYKKLMVQQGAVPPVRVNDRDFDIEISDD